MATFDLSALTTAAMCDEMLTRLQDEIDNNNRLLMNKEAELKDGGKLTTKVTAELAGKQAALASINTMIAGLPEGDYKERQIDEQQNLEAQIRKLNRRSTNYNAFVVLDWTIDVERLKAENAVLEDAKTQVDNRKKAL